TGRALGGWIEVGRCRLPNSKFFGFFHFLGIEGKEEVSLQRPPERAGVALEAPRRPIQDCPRPLLPGLEQLLRRKSSVPAAAPPAPPCPSGWHLRVQLKPLPCWAHLSAEEYRKRVTEVVEDIESQAALQRQLLDLPAKGPAAVRDQEPHAAPERL